MRAALLANADTRAVDNTALTAMCDCIADTVVAHIVAAAVVTIPPGVPVVVAVPAGTGGTTAPAIGAIT